MHDLQDEVKRRLRTLKDGYADGSGGLAVPSSREISPKESPEKRVDEKGLLAEKQETSICYEQSHERIDRITADRGSAANAFSLEELKVSIKEL